MPKRLEIDLIVEEEAWPSTFPDNLESLVQTTLEAAAAHLQIRPSSLCVLLTSDAAMQALNRQWRDQDRVTNILSFAPAHASEFLGDLALGQAIIAREAAAQGKPIAQHLQHLLIHGLLHLLGHDHADEDMATKMEAIEREVMAALGLPDPYVLEHEGP